MRRILLRLAPAALLALSPVAALAAGTATGAAGGAVAGAIVGGPVGAAVGGVIGAVIGTAVEPPPSTVITYVQTAAPPPSVMLEGDVAVGATLPPDVVLYQVPTTVYTPAGGDVYAYGVVNGQRVIVDTRTRAIVALAD